MYGVLKYNFSISPALYFLGGGCDNLVNFALSSSSSFSPSIEEGSAGGLSMIAAAAADVGHTFTRCITSAYILWENVFVSIVG